MLHRITVRMYDDNLLDATILDSLAGTDHRRRQEIIRTFIRVGYNQIMAGANANSLESLSGLDSLQALLVAGPDAAKVEPPARTPARTPAKASEQEEPVKETIQEAQSLPVIDEYQVATEAKDDLLLSAAPVVDEEEEDDMFNPLGQMARKFSEAD
jgi:hypothetical protein